MEIRKKITFVMLWHISERTGGAEVQANYLAEELAKRSYIVSYLCQTTNKQKIDTSQTINGVEVHWVKPSNKFIWLNIKTYYKILKKIAPDIVVQRNSSPLLKASAKYCKKHNAKLVWVCTDNLAPFKNFFQKRYTSRNSIENVGFFKYLIFYFNSIICDIIRNSAMQTVDLGFSQNKFQETVIKRNFSLSTVHMISGHHAIAKKSTDEIIAIQDKRTVLWCANFGRHKQPELFIELAKSMLNENLKFIMVGGHSDENYYNNLLINKPKNLEVIGHLSFEEALKCFAKTSLFVNTSSPGGDGFPNTFIQSWLRGVPVLTFGFDPDNIISNKNLGFKIKNNEQAKQSILELFSNRQAYLKLSVNVYQYAIKNHTVNAMTDHFINMINENK